MRTRRIAIIGAGAAGLCAARPLLARDRQVVIFEAGSHIGGLWVYEYDNGMSTAYRSLHVNSEAKVTAYKDFPFPDGSPLYPDHWQMTAYLEDYARHFDLVRHIRFRTPVARVERIGAGWLVVSAGGASERFDAVVVASGHQWAPRHPPFAAEFEGEYLHAHSYRAPEPFAGRDVLVVGIGNSACDIASDICTYTRSTIIAARSPVLLMPRMFLGVPTARVLGKLERPWMPWPLRRAIRIAISRAAHGTMEQWGFVTPRTRTHPAGHHLLIGHFIWNRITAKPGVKAVRGREVTFEDGSVRSFDVMIAATGYEVETPFLAPEHAPMEGKWADLFLRIAKPGVRGLYFMGFFNVSGGGNIRMMDDQGELVSMLECGELELPEQEVMREHMNRERQRIARLYPDSPRYGLELDPSEYRAAIARFRAAGRKSRPSGAARGSRAETVQPAQEERGNQAHGRIS